MKCKHWNRQIWERDYGEFGVDIHEYDDTDGTGRRIGPSRRNVTIDFGGEYEDANCVTFLSDDIDRIIDALIEAKTHLSDLPPEVCEHPRCA